MTYGILSIENIKESVDGKTPLTDSLFFTTDRTIGRNPALIRQAISRLTLPFHTIEEHTFRFARPHQTHSDHIYNLTEDFFSLTEKEQQARLESIDAVISNVKNACIGISTADCIPVLVYDKEHQAAAAIHAGWRGTLQRITEKTVKMMQKTFGTDPQQCHAVIGPGISQQSFEVGWEVHEAFTKAQFKMQDVTIILPANNGNGTKPHIDLKEINRLQLIHAGLKPQNITASHIDTYTDQRFFSARREQKNNEKCGRILTGFILF